MIRVSGRVSDRVGFRVVIRVSVRVVRFGFRNRIDKVNIDR